MKKIILTISLCILSMQTWCNDTCSASTCKYTSATATQAASCTGHRTSTGCYEPSCELMAGTCK